MLQVGGRATRSGWALQKISENTRELRLVVLDLEQRAPFCDFFISHPLTRRLRGWLVRFLKTNTNSP